MMMSTAVTEGIKVHVSVKPWPERSSPREGAWAYAYTIKIVNEGDRPARLLNRHWVITDASGKVEEVRGPGVVGKTPLLSPGEDFEYTSWVLLRTPFGTMKGSYEMLRPDGSKFNAAVAEFTLALPNAIN